MTWPTHPEGAAPVVQPPLLVTAPGSVRSMMVIKLEFYNDTRGQNLAIVNVGLGRNVALGQHTQLLRIGTGIYHRQ